MAAMSKFCFRISCFLILLRFFSGEINAQNIIPNPGFEDYSDLPDYFGEWYNCNDWLSPSGFAGYVWPYATTDYLHNNGSGYVKLPFSYFGTVHPHSGDAVMGFKTYRYDYEFREYLMNELIEPMISGDTYKISFWLMNGEENWMHGTGTNHVGIYFSLLPAEQDVSEPIDVSPQIEIPGIVWNTEWTYYEFYFEADANYDYITIGNFYGDDETLTELFDYSSTESNVCEYFIDDVSIINTEMYYINASICEGSVYLLPDGEIASETMIDTAFLTTAGGLDSVIITSLTVYPNYHITSEVIICENEIYELPDGSFAGTTGSYTDTLITINGCDSIITTQINVSENFDTTYYVLIDEGELISLPDGSQTGTAGEYEFNLTTENGCDSTITVVVSVLPVEGLLSELFIPNTFTPNGDGMNDYFFVYGEDISIIRRILIFDRWGELIYEIDQLSPSDEKNGWDGRFLNQQVLTGVYAYIVEVEMMRGEIRIEKGNVTLLR